MGWRKLIGAITAVIVFVLVGYLAIEAVLYLMGYSLTEGTSDHPLIRLFGWIIGAAVATMVYTLIKGNEPEPKNKKKQAITSKEISKKLKEKRNSRN